MNQEFDAKPQRISARSTPAPLALIMKGGGIKGLAYIGAIKCLEEKYRFNWFIGTSAGAVTALLLGAGFTTQELQEILRKKDFRDFLDGGTFRRWPNLVFRKGMHSGDSFTHWLDTLLAEKLSSVRRVRLSDLPNRVTIYASRRDRGALAFDSIDNDAEAAFAARCSMSIPFVFTPQSDQGISTYDGGIRNNYPVEQLLRDHPGTSFISLFLGSEVYEPVRQGSILHDLLHIATEATEREVVETHRERTIIIDPRPIATLDFGLTELEKDYLLAAGEAASWAHLKVDSKYQSASKLRDDLKSRVLAARDERRRQRVRRRCLWSAIAALVALLCWFLGTIDHLPSLIRDGPTTNGDVDLAVRTTSNGIMLRTVAAGNFRMGSNLGKPIEEPPHIVYLSKYELGVYEVTRRQYQELMDEKQDVVSPVDDAAATKVSWFEAVAFCNTLSELEGLSPYYAIDKTGVTIPDKWGDGFRLPTEAEWENACRAGSQYEYCFGNDVADLHLYAWYEHGTTPHPIGQKKPNKWGFHDMHGNVSEWCWDWFGENYYSSSPNFNPTGPEFGTKRACRGGSIHIQDEDQREKYCRSSHRSGFEPDAEYSNLGFRVARSPQRYRQP